MNSDDFFTLGYISKKRGYRGDVIINLDVDDPQKYRKIKTIYIKNVSTAKLRSYEIIETA